jgi:hypothetical protein
MRVPGLVLSALLNDSRLTLEEKTIRLAVEEFQPSSIYRLAIRVGVSRKFAAKACRNLARAGWLALLGDDHRLRPVPLIPESCQRELVQSLQAAYDAAANKGEFLTKRCLDLWVPTDQYEDNARPKFLRNLQTGQYMEYDRWYFCGHAFEWNGTQHFRTTHKFPSEKALASRQDRDSKKKDISVQHDVKLVVVTPLDLEPSTFGDLIPDGLPRAWVQIDSLYCRELTRLCRQYRQNTPVS